MKRAELPELIETERLLLRVRTVADAEAIYYLEHLLPERNQKDNLPAGYGIVVKGTDTVIGSVDFNHRHEDDVLEIGYTLHPDYWGRGYVPKVNVLLRNLISPLKLASETAKMPKASVVTS